MRKNTVYFKLKPKYDDYFDRLPVIKGTITGRCKNLFWVKMEEIKGKKASGTVCVNKQCILKRGE